MKAFDTDILTEILAGNPAYAERIAKVPVVESKNAPRIEGVYREASSCRRKTFITMSSSMP